MKNILKKLPIAVILCSTFLLLVVVGFGETRRTYIRFRLETSILQTDTVLDIIQPFLDAGFPITMYSGYDNIASIVSQSNEDVKAIQILDLQGKTVYSSTNFLPPEDILQNQSKIDISNFSNNIIYESGNIFRISRNILLSDGTKAGELLVFLDQEKSTNHVSESYRSVFMALAVSCGVLVLFFYLVTSNFKSKKGKRNRNIFIKILCALIFIFLSTYVTLNTIDLYEDGVRGKTEAIGNLLTERLLPAKELGIDFNDLTNINNILVNFKDRYSFIESVSINKVIGTDEEELKNQRIRYASNESMIDKDFFPDVVRLIVNYISLDSDVDYTDPENSELLMVVVSVPKTEVRNAVFDSIINLIALLIGASLITIIFLNVGLAYTESLNKKAVGDPHLDSMDPEISLQLIKAAYFLVVFVSSMAVPFLPLLVKELNNGLISSVPFSIYYLFFAMVLIPAGNLSAKGRIKEIMALGFIAEVTGCILVAVSNSIPFLTVGRAISGLGQGCFLIGFQSYVLSITPKEKRTQGAAIKVIARNSALIGGTAIGALLYVFMGFRRLFLLSSIISITGFVYLLLLVPKVQAAKKTFTKKLELKNIPKVFKDFGFLKVLVFTGIPAKMGITGVVSFGVPLLLAALGFAQEEIGRFLMLFFLISMLVTKIASRQADKSGNTHTVLFLSTLFGGLGMMMIGYQGLVLKSSYEFLAVIGLFLIGIANGLISAPIVTQITKTKSSSIYGYSPMIAVYTFLERFGHILGPMVVSFMIGLAGESTSGGIGMFGIITVALGMLFLITFRKQSFMRGINEVDERTSETYGRLLKTAKHVFKDIKRVSNCSILSLDVPAYDISQKYELEREITGFVVQTGLMHEIINDKKGRLLRYRGQNLQASWTSVFSNGSEVKNACDAALLYFKRLGDVEKLRNREGSSVVDGGVGIHSDEVVILNQKQQSVKENIIVGETLVASQYLSTLNDRYGTKIIVSANTRKQVEQEYVFRFLDIVKLPGSAKALTIYELLSSIRDTVEEDRIKFNRIYESAFYYYQKKDWPEARKYLTYLRNRLRGRDRSTELLYKKLLIAEKSPQLTGQNWIGCLDV